MNNINEWSEYVLGFLFSSDKKSVVLIKKAKPQWQAGLLNGVGGKIELNETSVQAMVREFQEETTSITAESLWINYADMVGPNWRVYCFYAIDSDLAVASAKTNTNEEVLKLDIDKIKDYQCVSNLSWLIPLALDENYGKLKFTQVTYY